MWQPRPCYRPPTFLWGADMTKEYLVSGNRFDLANDSVVLTGKRSASGPEIRLRVPVGTLLSLAMHARRALAGAQAQKAETVAGWKQVSALPIRTAKVLVPDDQTIGRCLLVLDEGTDAELQLSFPSAGFVRELAGELLAAADRIPQIQGRAN